MTTDHATRAQRNRLEPVTEPAFIQARRDALLGRRFALAFRVTAFDPDAQTVTLAVEVEGSTHTVQATTGEFASLLAFAVEAEKGHP